MIVRNYHGLVAGCHGEVRSLVGGELGKDWLLILLHKNAHHIPVSYTHLTLPTTPYV